MAFGETCKRGSFADNHFIGGCHVPVDGEYRQYVGSSTSPNRRIRERAIDSNRNDTEGLKQNERGYGQDKYPPGRLG